MSLRMRGEGPGSFTRAREDNDVKAEPRESRDARTSVYLPGDCCQFSPFVVEILSERRSCFQRFPVTRQFMFSFLK